MSNEFQVACFDMDGTFITNTNSVKYLCKINNKLDEALKIEEQENDNKFNWIEADYLKAKLLKGLNIKEVRNVFDKEIKLIGEIDKTIQNLGERKIKSILVTAGPIQVARLLGVKFGFEKVYGSNYEVKDDLFTGNIIRHLGTSGKVDSLISFCKENSILLGKCIAIGDSDSDVELFKKCQKSIAINYSDILVDIADVYIRTEYLDDILKYF